MNRSLLWVESDTLQQLFTQAGFPAGRSRSSRPTSALSSNEFSESSQSHITQRTSSLGSSALRREAEVTTPSPDTHETRSLSVASLTRSAKLNLPSLPHQILEGSIDVRLPKFMTWLAEETNASTIFLADEDGLPIASLRASEEEVAWGATLQQNLIKNHQLLFAQDHTLDLALESVVLRVDHMYCLGLLWAKGFDQTVVLGLFLPYYPETNLLDIIRDTLYLVLHEAGQKD